MEISTIQDWLQQGADYNAGVLLFEKFGSNETLLQLFRSGSTYFTRKKLHLELTTIYKQAIVPVAKIKESVQTPAPIRQKINPELLPVELKTEYNKLGDLIRNIGHLHGKLTAVITDKERYKISDEIIALVEQRRAIFLRIDNYIATGKDTLKVEEKHALGESEELKKFRLKNELQLLRSSRSKLKKKPHRIADYNEVLEKIKVLEKELNDEG